MPYQHLVHFTLAEADALLPVVIPTLERMRDLKRQLDEQGYDLRGHYYFVKMGMNGTQNYPSQMEELIDAYRDMHTRGIQIKDIDRGLIDFPCIRADGQEVYLCYMLGEPKIGYWHRIEDGFAGRKDISEL